MSASEIVLNAIKKERRISTNRAPEFPFSTCVECGRKIPAGSVQRCDLTDGGFCVWRVPAAVREYIKTLSDSQKPVYSLKSNLIFGSIILVSMLTGVAIVGVLYGW